MASLQSAVVITGASTGIGEATARHLAAADWRVFAGVRKAADGERLVASCPGDLRPLPLDVTVEADIEAAVSAVARQLDGCGSVALVNNAGIVVAGPLEFIPLDEVRKQFEVNVFGLLAVTQAFLPLIRQHSGRVVHVGSASGRLATPITGPYCASKFALEALADAMRLELLPWSIPVVLVEPGPITTPIWEKSTAAAEALRARMVPAAEERYGELFDRIRKFTEEKVGRGVPAEDVAEVVAEALCRPRPRARYVVGPAGKINVFVGRFVPDGLRDRLIGRALDLRVKASSSPPRS